MDLAERCGAIGHIPDPEPDDRARSRPRPQWKPHRIARHASRRLAIARGAAPVPGEHGKRKIDVHRRNTRHLALGLAREISRPTANIYEAVARPEPEVAYRIRSPAPIDAEAQHSIEKVVARSHRIEHGSDLVPGKKGVDLGAGRRLERHSAHGR
jgi:hypothetical protein